MSQLADPPPGLRERKKIQLRQAVQREALRLFAAQGYDQTTVEQITAAAQTSTSTFYRYFPTKEDAVLDDDYDPLAEQTIAGRPAGEPLLTTVRAALAAVVAAVEADREQNLTRLRLKAAIPALTARQAVEGRKTFDLIARVVAARTGRSIQDYQLRLAAAALTAAQSEASRYWADHDGTDDLAELMDQAVTAVGPLLTALDPCAG
jgi:AcrR family transcriptional regulator